MASIHKVAHLNASAESVWSALRDVGKVANLFPGVLTDSRLEDCSRKVTFANGRTITERIVTIDDSGRRLVYAAQGEGFTHHNASMQVVPELKGSSRFIWTSDFLPDELSAQVAPLIDAGLRSFVAHWESALA